jgi:hypothetical protein
MSEPASATNSQTIQLTPNTNSITTGSGDSANSTKVQFGLTPSGPTCWEAIVSIDQSTFKLHADLPCANVIYKQGLTVQYQANPASGGYVILLSGTIEDGQPYQFAPSIVIYVSP